MADMSQRDMDLLARKLIDALLKASGSTRSGLGNSNFGADHSGLDNLDHSADDASDALDDLTNSSRRHSKANKDLINSYEELERAHGDLLRGTNRSYDVFGQFEKTVGNSSQSLKGLSATFSALLDGYGMSNDALDKFSHKVNQFIKTNSLDKLSKINKGAIKNIQELEESQRKLLAGADFLDKSIQDSGSKFQDIINEVSNASKSSLSGANLALRQILENNDLLGKSTEQIKDHIKASRDQVIATAQYTYALRKMHDIEKNLEERFGILGKAIMHVSAPMLEWGLRNAAVVQSIKIAGPAILALGTAAIAAFNQFKTIAGTNVAGSYIDLKQQQVQLGLSFEDTSKIFNSNVKGLNAIGFDKFSSGIYEAEGALRKFGFTNEQSAQMQAQYQKTLMESGVSIKDEKRMKKAIIQNRDAFIQLHGITGASIEEFQAFKDEMANSADVQTQLLGVSAEERIRRINDMDMLRNTFTKLGGSAEVANKAMMSLNQFANSKMTDRFQASFKAQIALSQLGVKNAAQIGAFLRKGNAMTADERTQVAEAFKIANENAATLKTQGAGTGKEILADYQIENLNAIGGEFNDAAKKMALGEKGQGGAIAPTEVIAAVDRTKVGAMAEAALKWGGIFDSIRHDTVIIAAATGAMALGFAAYKLVPKLLGGVGGAIQGIGGMLGRFGEQIHPTVGTRDTRIKGARGKKGGKKGIVANTVEAVKVSVADMLGNAAETIGNASRGGDGCCCCDENGMGTGGTINTGTKQHETRTTTTHEEKLANKAARDAEAATLRESRATRRALREQEEAIAKLPFHKRIAAKSGMLAQRGKFFVSQRRSDVIKSAEWLAQTRLGKTGAGKATLAGAAWTGHKLEAAGAAIHATATGAGHGLVNGVIGASDYIKNTKLGQKASPYLASGAKKAAGAIGTVAKAGTGALKGVAEIAGPLMKGVGKTVGWLGKKIPIITAAFALADGYAGWNDADKKFKLPEGVQATTGQKVTAAVTGAVGGLLDGLTFGLLGSSVTNAIDSVGTTIYSSIAGDPTQNAQETASKKIEQATKESAKSAKELEKKVDDHTGAMVAGITSVTALGVAGNKTTTDAINSAINEKTNAVNLASHILPAAATITGIQALKTNTDNVKTVSEINDENKQTGTTSTVKTPKSSEELLTEVVGLLTELKLINTDLRDVNLSQLDLIESLVLTNKSALDDYNKRNIGAYNVFNRNNVDTSAKANFMKHT